jgi:O-antigen/teichoic acid export membrane protein
VFARNAGLILLQRGVTFTTHLVLIPYVVRRLGIEGYGLLAASSAVAVVIGTVDLGLGSTAVKFLAERVEQGDATGVNRVFWSAVLLRATLSAVMFSAWAGVGATLLAQGSGPWLSSEALIVFTVALAGVLLSNVGQTVENLFWATYRTDIVSLVQLAAIPVYIGGVVWVLERGHGPVGVAVVEAGALLVLPVAGLACIVRLACPTIRFQPRYFSVREASALLHYGARIQMSTLVNVLWAQAGRFLGGALLDLRALTFFDLAAKLAQPVTMLPTLMSPLFVPISSQLSRRRLGDVALCGLYQRALGSMAVLLVAAVGYGTVFSGAIVRAWMGEGFGLVVLGFVSLLWLNLFEGLSLIGRSFLRGIGVPGIETRFEVVRTVLSVGLGALACWAWGYPGLILGLTVGSISVCTKFLIQTSRLFGLHGAALWRGTLATPTAMAVAASGVASLTLLIDSEWAWPLLGGGVAFCAVYGMGIVWSGQLALRELWAGVGYSTVAVDAARIDGADG